MCRDDKVRSRLGSCLRRNTGALLSPLQQIDPSIPYPYGQSGFRMKEKRW